MIRRGDHKGIACVALSIVDGRGRLVKHFSYPRPAPGGRDEGDMRTLEDMIVTQVYSEAGETSSGPGPMALIQFRVWESGRLDLEKLTSLLHTAIRQSLWDAMLEYRMISAPLALADLSESLMEAMEDTEVGQEDGVKENPFINDEEDRLEAGNLPEIVIEANELVEKADGCVLDEFEDGVKGTLHPVYSSGVFKWFERGLELESPSVFKHSVDLVASSSLPLILKEIQNQIVTIIPDLKSVVFQQKDQTYRSYIKGSVLHSRDEFIIVSRNQEHWKIGTREEMVDPGLMKTREVKASQNFHPLILGAQAGSGLEAGDLVTSVSPPSLTPNTSSVVPPLTPTTPALTNSGLTGLLQTIQTTNQV